MYQAVDTSREVVGLGDMKVSQRADGQLITYSLGSCIGLALFDPMARIGGLIHCMLPLSRNDPEKARANPRIFTDSGVLELLQAVFDLGAERKRLRATVAGASTFEHLKHSFNIAERNHIVLRKTLWKNEIRIVAEDVGGTVARSMCLDMRTGMTSIIRKP